MQSDSDFGIPITRTLKLDECWVCGRPLPEGAPREEHHPLPQHAVGSHPSNPTVTICLDHHELVHDAVRKTRKNPHALLSYLIPDRDKQNHRFTYLVRVAQMAEALVSKDPNKRFVFSIWLSGSIHREMLQVQRAWNVSSQEKLIERLIHLAHAQTFPASLQGK